MSRSANQYAARCKAAGRPVPGQLPDVNSSWRKRPTLPAPAAEPTIAELKAQVAAYAREASRLLARAESLCVTIAKREAGL